jgi:hypothetical protein
MKRLIPRITAVTFTLATVNRAKITATGEVSTAGWSGSQLDGPRLSDGILHFSFVAEPPNNAVSEVITAISAHQEIQLGTKAQDVTVHAEMNEMSVQLPAAGDPI